MREMALMRKAPKKSYCASRERRKKSFIRKLAGVDADTAVGRIVLGLIDLRS